MNGPTATETIMFEVKRAGRVLGRILGRRDLAATKAEAIARFGKGVSLTRAI